MNPEKVLSFKNKISKNNHYLIKAGYTSFYEYLKDKYGIDRAEAYRNNFKSKRSGSNNNMYGKGYKLAGNKNGRAVEIIIHFQNGQKYYCNGTFKKFSKEVLSNYKPQPHRFCKYGIENRGWFINKINSIKDINIKDYIIYE